MSRGIVRGQRMAPIPEDDRGIFEEHEKRTGTENGDSSTDRKEI